MFWTQITIPGRPKLLVIDIQTGHPRPDENLCDKIFNVLSRKGVPLSSKEPSRVSEPDQLAETITTNLDFNCMLLVCESDLQNTHPTYTPKDYWNWLSTYRGLPAVLLAICTPNTYDEQMSNAVLEGQESFAQIAVAPRSTLSVRASGLFYMKFFTELDLHAHDSITGKMVWFSHSKAREILRRRKLEGQVGIRC